MKQSYQTLFEMAIREAQNSLVSFGDLVTEIFETIMRLERDMFLRESNDAFGKNKGNSIFVSPETERESFLPCSSKLLGISRRNAPNSHWSSLQAVSPPEKLKPSSRRCSARRCPPQKCRRLRKRSSPSEKHGKRDRLQMASLPFRLMPSVSMFGEKMSTMKPVSLPWAYNRTGNRRFSAYTSSPKKVPMPGEKSSLTSLTED